MFIDAYVRHRNTIPMYVKWVGSMNPRYACWPWWP